MRREDPDWRWLPWGGHHWDRVFFLARLVVAEARTLLETPCSANDDPPPFVRCSLCCEWRDHIRGLLVFPQHRVAVDIREGDVLFMQAHRDIHGNTPIVGDGKRLSIVTYLKHGLADTVNACEVA